MTLFEFGESSGDVSLRALFESGEVSAPAVGDEPDVYELVCRGGWPGLVDADSAGAQQLLRDYLTDLCKADIGYVDRARRDPAGVARLLESLARNIATSASRRVLAADMDTVRAADPRTVAAYLSALEQLFVLEHLTPWPADLRSRAHISATPKRYLVDPSLAVAVCALASAASRRDRLWRCCTMKRMAGDPQAANGAADPFKELDASERLVVAALRGRHRGATAAALAADTELSQHTALRCLGALAARNLVECTRRRVASFHVPLLVDVWSLSNLAWKALRWMPARLKAAPSGGSSSETGLPVELWPVFWSGQRVSEFRVLADGDRICEPLLQAPMIEARVWALLNLPCDVLERSRHRDEPLLRHLVAARRG